MALGELVLYDPSTGYRIPLKNPSIELTGKQTGALCSFILSQRIENDDKSAASAKYIYQTDNKFCIFKTRFFIEDTEILIKIHDKNESKEIYEEAVSKGQTAVLSKRVGDGYNEIDIGNVPPNKTCKVETHFTFIAAVLDPLTITVKIPIDIPSYCNNINFKFSFDIEPLVEISSIRSDNIIQINNSNTKIETEVLPDNMSIFFIERLKAPLRSYILRNNEYLCLNFCAEEENQVDTNDLELIFVADCSGSMSGANIKRASECLEVFLRSLPFGCKFNIYRYGDIFEHLFDVSQPYDKNSAQKAFDYARKLAADLGGTNLSSALNSIYKTKSNNRILFVLTDGEDFYKEQVMTIVQSDKSTRIFSIGLGNGADHGLVEYIARETNGKSISIFSGDALTENVIQLLDQALKKPLPSYSIECEGCNTPEIQPHPFPMLFSGSPVQFFIKAPNVNSMIVCFDGDGVDTTISDVYNVSNDSIKALFSMFCINILETMILDEPSNQELKEKMINHSIESGVLCSLTAYVGVDETYQPAIKEDADIDSLLNQRQNSFSHLSSDDEELCDCYSSFDTHELDEEYIRYAFRLFSDDSSMPNMIPSQETISDSQQDQGENQEFMELLRLQEFEGCWTSVSQILAIYKINKEIVLEGISNEMIVSTILALAIIQKKHIKREQSSKYVIDKAKTWIRSQVRDFDVDELISKVLIQLE